MRVLLTINVSDIVNNNNPTFLFLGPSYSFLGPQQKKTAFLTPVPIFEKDGIPRFRSMLPVLSEMDYNK